VSQKLSEHSIDYKMTSMMTWFITIFAWGVPENTSLHLLDIFLLKGQSSRFLNDAALAMLHV
jgi:hypothetical protein